MKNKVALLTAIGKLEIEEQELVYSAKSDRKALVKMTSVGICGSDIHYFEHGGLGSFKQPMPMPMGHEPAGVVYDVPLVTVVPIIFAIKLLSWALTHPGLLLNLLFWTLTSL